MLPWYMADNDVISMFNAQVHPSVWLGVIGRVIVGDLLRREFGRLPVPNHVDVVCEVCWRLYGVGFLVYVASCYQSGAG